MVKILIAGGGIGGLAAALSTAQRGHTVTVLERRGIFTEQGAGIQLAPNAFHALDHIGTGDTVRERAVFIDELRFMDGTTNHQVASLPLTDTYRKRFGNPYAVMHRIDLYEPLLAACRQTPQIQLRVDSSVTHYEQDTSTVTAVLDNGKRFTGAALIGADGIRSSIRRQLVGDGEPRVSGHTIYRSIIPMKQVPHELRWNAVTLWAGPKWHFVHYPIGRGEYLNLAATRDDNAEQAVMGRPTEKTHVLGEFPELSDTPRRLLNLGENWKSWVLCDRNPHDHWTDQRVTLLGDAAHPMLQYAAQGACMALEDAVLIGELLDCPANNITQQLEKFATQRRDRTAKAQLLAREMGRQLYHPTGKAAQQRNTMLSSLTHNDLYNKIAWLHNTQNINSETGSTKANTTGILGSVSLR